ncbi:short-chain dehydrogenase/reductase SDR [Podospora fimiseda]|uniref:Short-chain dehydrogenase/reductase SDR n=1 Tax=Podospora fimiseda TaxID=252190 RepID=A0AAN7BEL3_9PEZI|nr:short-chain dehydrogenase/reductase SDR [Podospora fimiseda]
MESSPLTPLLLLHATLRRKLPPSSTKDGDSVVIPRLKTVRAAAPPGSAIAGFSTTTLPATAVGPFGDLDDPKLLILTGRNIDKLDLGSFSSVRDAATEVLEWEDVPVIDILVNNAGIIAVDYALSAEGHELHFTTNHLGHFLFTNFIMPKILGAAEPRIVNVTSSGRSLSAVRFGDLDFNGGKEYNKWRAYGQSKTANILFATSFVKKLGGKGLIAVSVHPGLILTTGFGTHISRETEAANLLAVDLNLDRTLKPKTEDKGVATHVFASFHPSIKEHNGAYLQDCHVSEADKDWAKDDGDAERLWKLSEDLVEQEFVY